MPGLVTRSTEHYTLHSWVLGATAEAPVTGRKADVMMAAHLASEAALRLVKPGNENTEVTETISKIGEAYDCKVERTF